METPDKPRNRRSLVLAGGGVRLAYHAGVLIALEEEEGLQFQHVDGTSGGIFGAAMLASGIKPEECAKRWRKLELKGFLSMMPLRNYTGRYRLKAMGSAEGIRRKIFPALGIRIEKINAQQAFDTTFNVCNFSKKTVEAVPNDRVTEGHLVAGMSLPIFMPAVRINGDWYTDAVWIKDANLTEAVNRGAEEIWLAWCIGNTAEYLNGFFNQYVHMIEMSANAGLAAEIDELKRVNTEREKQGLNSIVLHIIKPKLPLPLDPDFFLNRINADTLINWGYADAKRYLEEKKPFDFSNASYTATLMKNADAVLHFRQQFEDKASLDGKQEKIIIRLSIFIRKEKEKTSRQQFASVQIGEKCIPGYRNQLSPKGKGVIFSEFDFLFNGKPCHALLELHFSTPWEIQWGLAFKSAKAKLQTETSSEFMLYQPALTRIKNSFYLNVKAETGWFEKQRLKKQLLETLLTE